MDEYLWDLFVQKNYTSNLNNLVLIDKCITAYKEVDKNLKISIHKDVINAVVIMVNQGKLKNIELLNFLKENIYFRNNKYSSLEYRPIEILDGIDLENINEDFYKLWDEVNIFKIFSILETKPKAKIIDKINHMKDFGKLLRLFNFQDKKIIDKAIIILFYRKFASLTKSYTKESCPNFIKDISLLIYKMDQLKKNDFNLHEFLEGIIQRNFDTETIKEIYLCISKNYQDISKDLIKDIIIFFINDKNDLKIQKIIDLIKSVSNTNIYKSIFNKIDSFVIKEEELFNEKLDIESFKLLDWIQKEKLFENYNELKDTIYADGTNKVQKKILEHIKTGNIRYNSISAWYITNINNFKEKLKIILFHKENDYQECIKCLNQYFSKIKKELNVINKLNSLLKEFYEHKHIDNIKFLNELEFRIKNGLLNEIEKERTKNELIKMNQILPDLDEQNKLKNSLFFIHFLKKNKSNKKNETKNDDQILELTKEDFGKLKLLFENNWYHNINESIIKTCYDTIKSLEKNDVQKEIVLLKKYFKLDNVDELIIEKITEQIIALSKKEKIFLTLKGCINFIEETKVKQTEFSDELRKFLSNLSSNITPEKITLSGKQLEKYGINVLDAKPEDQDYLGVIHSLYRKKGALGFILKLTTEDCHYLQELCSETENTFLTVADIQDMEKCSKFMKNLIGDVTNKTDLESINIFKNELQNSKNISIVFEQYANNSRQIQELFSQKLDKSQATLKKIK